MKSGTEKKRSELEALFVDAEEADVDRSLREALEGRIAFERTSGRVLPRPGLFKLSQPERVLVLLLARQALARLRVPDTQLDVSAEDLASEAQVPLKNCREHLSRLKAGGIIAKGTKGYLLPAWNILLATERLKSTKRGVHQ